MKYQVKDNKDIQVELNTDIFKLLYPNSNDKLLNMNNSDKVYVMMLLKKFILEYRKKINISKDITFASEIEFEESYRDEIEQTIYTTFPNGEWIVKDDRSLSNGGEINSPILRDTENSWIDLRKVCNIVERNAYVSDETSAHVHVGMQILGNNPKYWYNFALLWMTYENIITRFLYGEYISPRPRKEYHAASISKNLINNLERLNRIKNISLENGESAKRIIMALNGDGERRKAVNFKNAAEALFCDYTRVADKNTIEFRGANGTFNPIIWQNNINLLVKLLEYCKSNNFNEELIIRRLNNIIANNIPSNIYKYSQIHQEQALELADLIFSNNLDKIYFLRQYIKDYRVTMVPLIKSEPFTKQLTL